MSHRFALAPSGTKVAAPNRADRHLRSDFVPWVGLCLLALLLALSAALAIHQRQQIIDSERDNAVVLTRVLEEQTSRHLDATELIVSHLGDRLHLSRVDRLGALNDLLVESSRASPLLRSLSIVSATGDVLASSTPENRLIRIDLDRVGRSRNPEQFRIGPWLPGRDLFPAALPNLPVPGQAASGAAIEPIQPGVGLVAMTRQFTSADGQPVYVVAALNTAFLANQFDGMVADSGHRAVVMNLQGMVMAATPSTHFDAGDVLPMHPRLLELLPQQDHGSYVGIGMDDQDAVAAFRATRKQPWVVVVERSSSDIVLAWRRGVTGMVVVTGILAALIGWTTWLAWRTLQNHERLEQDLASAKRRLEENERSLRGLIEAAPAPMFVLDALGHYAMVNHAFEDFLAVRREDLIGAGRPLSPHLQQLAYHPVHDVPLWQGTGRSHYLEDVPSVDGRMREALISKVGITRENGRPRTVIGSITDVTELREAERQMREAMQASQLANVTKNEFIANMSHGLRTPLQSVLGFAELGQMRSAEQPALHEIFGDIHSAGRRMLWIVNDLLDLSRLESSVGILHRDVTDLHELTAALLTEMRPAFAERGIDLRSVEPGRADLASDLAAKGDPPPDAGRSAWVDKVRVQQALRNVLANALSFAPADSVVDVALTFPDEDTAQWAVLDQGPGIPEHELPHLFEAFYHGRRTRDTNGAFGLGLAIARKIMQTHGGDATAMNQPLGGAAFRLSLRMA
ncbi:MAG: ATP-binding protein [Leptothrix sp. (in: b-proteobacteria)]